MQYPEILTTGFSSPAIMFVIFLAVGDEDVVFKTLDEACHITSSLSQSYERVGCKSNLFSQYPMRQIINIPTLLITYRVLGYKLKEKR